MQEWGFPLTSEKKIKKNRAIRRNQTFSVEKENKQKNRQQTHATPRNSHTGPIFPDMVY